MTQRYSEDDPEDTPLDSPEAKRRDEEFRREMSAWKNNPMTKQIRIGLEEQAAVAFRSLLSAGLNSSDATVSRHAAQYDALTKLVKNMKESPDGV